jgi:hypothetical protein
MSCGLAANGRFFLKICRRYLELRNWDGTLERIHHELYVAVREQEGREASPTIVIIDAQTAKGAKKGGLRSIVRAMTRTKRSRSQRHALGLC